MFVFVGVAGAVVTEVGVVPTVVVGEVTILVAAEALFFGVPRSFWIHPSLSTSPIEPSS